MCDVIHYPSPYVPKPVFFIFFFLDTDNELSFSVLEINPTKHVFSSFLNKKKVSYRRSANIA